MAKTWSASALTEEAVPVLLLTLLLLLWFIRALLLPTEDLEDVDTFDKVRCNTGGGILGCCGIPPAIPDTPPYLRIRALVS